MFRDFFDLIFPNCCIACNNTLLKGEQHVCIWCYEKLPKTDFHKQRDNSLCKKLWGRVPIKYGLAYLYFSKGGKVQSILHHIKYKEAKEAAQTLGYWYGNDLYKVGFTDTFDIIVPVPLHKKKLRKRGYNQSTYFAIGLSEGLSVSYTDHALERVREQSTQTNKTRLDRWSNVKEIYKIKNAEHIQAKHVLLTDDVATTGATIEACVQVLLDAGAKEVSVIVLAIAS